mgnify:CR=1 FL=1
MGDLEEVQKYADVIWGWSLAKYLFSIVSHERVIIASVIALRADKIRGVLST